MRLLSVFVVAVLAACSGKETAEVKNGGSAGSGGGAGEPSDGGSGGSAGSVATGSGAAAGSSAATGSGAAAGSNAGGATGGEAGNGAAGASQGGTGAGGGALFSCDHRQVLCKSVEPPCPDMQVARVEDGCWGPCTDIHLCACSSAEECPHEETYTCWGKEHCGPYVR